MRAMRASIDPSRPYGIWVQTHPRTLYIRAGFRRDFFLWDRDIYIIVKFVVCSFVGAGQPGRARRTVVLCFCVSMYPFLGVACGLLASLVVLSPAIARIDAGLTLTSPIRVCVSQQALVFRLIYVCVRGMMKFSLRSVVSTQHY